MTQRSYSDDELVHDVAALEAHWRRTRKSPLQAFASAAGAFVLKIALRLAPPPPNELTPIDPADFVDSHSGHYWRRKAGILPSEADLARAAKNAQARRAEEALRPLAVTKRLLERVWRLGR
jgi:hypothetical protein